MILRKQTPDQTLRALDCSRFGAEESSTMEKFVRAGKSVSCCLGNEVDVLLAASDRLSSEQIVNFETQPARAAGVLVLDDD